MKPLRGPNDILLIPVGMDKDPDPPRTLIETTPDTDQAEQETEEEEENDE